MDFKTCHRCQESQPDSNQFFPKRGEGLESVCKSCKRHRYLNRTSEQRQREKDRLHRSYLANKEEKNRKREIKRKANRAIFAERQRTTRSRRSPEKREAGRLKSAKWYDANRDRALARCKARRDEIRAEMFDVYGCVCACCGEEDTRFLTLDHVNGGGGLHRKVVNGGGNGVMYSLKAQGWPKEGFQILCYNCNCARARHGGICPHSVQI